MNKRIVSLIVWPLYVISALNLALPEASAKNSAAEKPAYDELYDRRGRLRPQYRGLAPYIESESPRRRKIFENRSLRLFEKDNAVDSLPKILTAAEHDLLRRGAEQRAMAILAFLYDHYSGEKKYLRAGLIPQTVVDGALHRSLEHVYADMVVAKNIAFFIGTDFFRAPDGKFVAVEDNLGKVGGIGDLKLSYELVLEQHPQLKELNLAHPMDFFKRLATEAKHRAVAKNGKAIAVLLSDKQDHENVRLKKIWEELGVEVVTPRSDVKLVFENEAVYTQPKKGGRREKVGFVMTAEEYMGADLSIEANEQRYLIYQAKSYIDEWQDSIDHDVKQRRKDLINYLAEIDPKAKLTDMAKLKTLLRRAVRIDGYTRPNMVSGLTNAVLKGHVLTSYSPGVDFAGDKELYLYVEDFIRFYFGEEPLVHNIKTWRFADSSGVLDHAVFNKVFKNVGEYVIKPVDGRAGDGIFIGNDLKSAQIHAAKRAVRQDPSRYVAQQYTPPSKMRGRNSDFRPIVYASMSNTIGGPVWGRNNNSSFINVHKGGAVTAILVEKQCEELLEAK